MKTKTIKIIIYIFIITSIMITNISAEEIIADTIEEFQDSGIENSKVLNEYLTSANEYLKRDRFDKALEMLKEAELNFPLSPLPNLKKGNLYTSHKLYDNALGEYLKAKRKGYLSEELYRNIASLYSKVGNDKEALKTYQEAFNKFSKNREIYDSLGWLNFKVHNVKKGIEITKEGLELFPNSSELFMTLGTLYSDIWDYENSKKAYYDSIKYSYQDYKSNYFRSVVYYNISVLEKNFLNYQDSLNSVNASIGQENRGTPHIQLAILRIFSLNLSDALIEVREAINLKPDTMFSHYLLSYIYITAGELDNAITILKSLEKNSDFEWMQFFGMNKDTYFSEVFSYISQAYEYKANQIKFREKNNFFESLLVPFKSLYYKILSNYYLNHHANLSIKIAEELIDGGSILEGINQLYNTYKRVDNKKAKKMLILKENLPIQMNHNMKRLLLLDKIILDLRLKRSSVDGFFSGSLKDGDIFPLIKSIESLDPKWEREIKAESLYELIKVSKGEIRERAIRELFLIHSPYIGLYGLKLGVSVEFTSDTANRGKIVSLLKKSGFGIDSSSPIKAIIKPLPNDLFSITLVYEDSVIKSDNFSLKNNNLSKEIFDSFFVYMFK